MLRLAEVAGQPWISRTHFEAAAVSSSTVVSRWSCRNEAGQEASTAPPSARATIGALCTPVASRTTRRASRRSAIPTVSASRGQRPSAEALGPDMGGLVDAPGVSR